jgi:hypothetical protein
MQSSPSRKVALPRCGNLLHEWIVGGCCFEGIVVDFSASPVRPLSGLETISQFLGKSESVQLQEFARRLSSLIDSVRSVTIGDELDPMVKFMADSVSLAVLRRISRESVYTAGLIDQAAKLLNLAFRSIECTHQIHLMYIEDLDRLTLKILARCVLTQLANDRFQWCWHFRSDPREEIVGLKDHELARKQLLAGLQKALNPVIVSTGVLPNDGNQIVVSVTDFDICCALVLQDYESCLRWICSGMDLNPWQLRISAIAMINLGWRDAAQNALFLAERDSLKVAEKAHLCYLQGLIEAKRSYRLNESDAHYLRGLSIVDRSQADGSESDEIRIERAWLNNGLALNDVLRFRSDTSLSYRLKDAFRRLEMAFNLVREIDSNQAVYLRYNLLANMAFLMEIGERWEVAISLMEQVFAIEMGHTFSDKGKWDASLSYRLGLLYLGAGDHEKCKQWLERSLSGTTDESWFLRERVLRGVVVAAFKRGDHSSVLAAANEGFELCIANRSFDGTVWHGTSLSKLFRLLNDTQNYNRIQNRLTDEGIDLPSVERPVSPKLPAYIPELDLEDIPILDLNVYLSNSSSALAFAEASSLERNL